MLFQQYNGTIDDVPRLGVIKSAGVNIFFHLFHVGFGKGFQRGKACKERRRDHVDAGIGALSRKPNGKQQLIILAVIQRADSFGILGQKPPDDFIDLFLCTHVYTP